MAMSYHCVTTFIFNFISEKFVPRLSLCEISYYFVLYLRSSYFALFSSLVINKNEMNQALGHLCAHIG